MTTTPEHQPAGYNDDGTPLDCLVCGQPWPCAERPRVARGQGHGIYRADGRPNLTLTATPDGPVIDRDTINVVEGFTLALLDAADPDYVQGAVIIRDCTGLALLYRLEHLNGHVARGYLLWRSDMPDHPALPGIA